MELIKLNENNLKDIVEIDNSAFAHCWSEQIFLEELNTITREYYGFVNDGILIAYIGLDIVFENCDIIRVAVHKNFQNNGIAKKLLLAVFEKLKQKEISKIMLEVSDINTYAIKLYESVGFNKIFERKNYYEDGSNALIYELNI